MAGNENSGGLTLGAMRGIVERLQVAHVPLDERLDALMHAACHDGMAATKDGWVVTAAEMYRDDLVDQSPLTINRIDPTPGYCPPKETGGLMMTGENLDSFTLVEKQSLGLVPVAPEVNRFQAVGAISSLPEEGGCHMIKPGTEISIPQRFVWLSEAAPVELVPEGERIAVRERDEARAKITQMNRDWSDAARLATDAVNGLSATAEVRDQEIASLRAQLASRDARIAELDSELARRPAAKAEEPKVPPNAFREFARDRRRIGG